MTYCLAFMCEKLYSAYVMKHIFLLLIAFVFSAACVFAKNINLNPQILADGSVVIENVKGKIEDRINIENTTDVKLSITIVGVEKKGKEEILCETMLSAHEKRYIATEEDDDLDDFVRFRIEVKNASIEYCTAQCEWSDLYLIINKVTVKGSGSAESLSENVSAADELLKWKKLLDAGAVTQEEYEAKKKQLLAL